MLFFADESESICGCITWLSLLHCRIDQSRLIFMARSPFTTVETLKVARLSVGPLIRCSRMQRCVQQSSRHAFQGYHAKEG